MLWKQLYLHMCTLSNDSLSEWQLQCRETTHVHIIRNNRYWICCDLHKRCYFNHSIKLHILCMTLWEATVEIIFHSRNQSFNYPIVFQWNESFNASFFAMPTNTLLPFSLSSNLMDHERQLFWGRNEDFLKTKRNKTRLPPKQIILLTFMIKIQPEIA